MDIIHFLKRCIKFEVIDYSPSEYNIPIKNLLYVYNKKHIRKTKINKLLNKPNKILYIDDLYNECILKVDNIYKIVYLIKNNYNIEYDKNILLNYLNCHNFAIIMFDTELYGNSCLIYYRNGTYKNTQRMC